MNRNYQKELDRIIQKQGEKRPRVLLHACCGVCSSAVLEYLTPFFDLTILWYNPNLYPQEEFDRLMDRVGDTMDWCEPNEDFCEEIGDEDYDEEE